ncbi:MAG: hypothetical protein OEV87_02515 [Phycisphaerae bacterium]|nr:hypothetical protein [Phycisphaerae bacterium]
MLHKASVSLIAVSLICTLLFSGCGSTGSISLKFVPQETVMYKSTTDVIKDYRFEQPTMGKLTEQQTKNTVVMEYSQDVQSVDESGNAALKITIDQLKVDIINKNDPQLSFDSQNEADKNAPLAKLIGQSYTIRMTPSGNVKVLDTKEAMAAVTAAYEKKIVKNILDPKNIVARHEIPSIPNDPAMKLSVKSTWSQIVPPLPDMFASKSFEKTYTLTAIDGTIATIQMTGNESAKPAEGAQSNMMNPFAKLFDNKDDYTGSMQIDLATGKVLKSEEILVSSSLMEEMPENGDPKKGPDTLTMRFTNHVKLEKLN